MWPWSRRAPSGPRWTVLSDVGRKRDHNEDAGAAIPGEPGWGFDAALIVCDGVGGSARGERASSTTVENLRAALARADGTPIAERLRAAIAASNTELREYARAELEGASMGTTVVAAVVTGMNVTVAHAGDSRAYRIRGREIEQLTADHSFVAEQVRAGVILAAEARDHPLRSRITRAVGMADGDARPEIAEATLARGDVLLLCSDGLHGLVEDREMAAAVGKDLEKAARELVALANARGGPDNITVALYRAS